jgi:hypothetical protein
MARQVRRVGARVGLGQAKAAQLGVETPGAVVLAGARGDLVVGELARSPGSTAARL